MIILSVYNNRTYVNKGLSKTTRAKNIVAQKKKEYQQKNNIVNDQAPEKKSAKEILAEIYSGQQIDLYDPNGFYLLNSGYRIGSQGGLGRIENPAFTGLLEDLFQREVFQQLAQSRTTATEIMDRAVDLNGRINISTAQKTKTIGSIQDLKHTYSYMEQIENQKGNIFIFDTETIGGKNRTGIWNPLAITEFAMQQYNYGTGQTTSTNIVMGLAKNADNQRVYEDIVRYMEAENWAAIEQNEELFVTAKRAGLYADAEIVYNPNLGYSEIKRLGEGKDDWKNLDKFKKGWANLENAYSSSAITSEGLKASDKALFDAVALMQSQMDNNKAMILGQNMQMFDEPVVNTQLKKTYNFYKEIVNSPTLAATRGISVNQAKQAVDYMDKTLAGMGGAFKMDNKKSLDTLALFQVVRDYFGIDTLYNGDKDAIKAAGSGLAKQENIGAAWFKDLFSDAMAHMADFDVTVLNYAATKGLQDKGGMSLIKYLMTAAGSNGKGIMGIDDKATKLRTGQIFYSSGGTGTFDYMGKGVLNFTHNEKTGEIFTSSGYKFVNGKPIGYEDSKINMGTDLKKGYFYTLESVKEVNAEDIHKSLGDVVPDMSGKSFISAQFRMTLPHSGDSNGLEHITYNFLFNSEKQFSAFMSNTMKLAIDTDLNGRQYILEDALDLFDKMEVDPFGDVVRESEIKQISHSDLIQRTLKQSLKDYQTEKAYAAIFGSDSSYRNIQKMMNVKGFLESEELKKQLGENISMANIDHNELNRLIDGKTIRNLTDDQTEYISNKVNSILGFNHKKIKEKVLYSNTQRNIVYAWDPLMAQDKFYNTVLNNLKVEAKRRKWNQAQTSIAFNDLVETMRVQAAEMLSTGNAALDKSRIANTRAKEASAYQLKNIYDIQLPKNFSIEGAHTVDVDSFSSSTSRDIIRLDLSKDESYNLVSQLRRHMYGDKPLKGDITDYDRNALDKYIFEVLGKDKQFNKTKSYKKIVKDVTGENKGTYNVNYVSRKILDMVSRTKEYNPSFGILKEIETHTLDFDKEMIDMLNSDDILSLIDYNIKNNMVKPINTRELLQNKGAGLDAFIKNNLMEHYMPTRDAFKKAMDGLEITGEQRFIKDKLYDLLYENISGQLKDVLTMASKVEGVETAISPTGQITVSRYGKSIPIKGIPKVGMDNGHLYGIVGNQNINLHLDLGYDPKTGKGTIKTNLGEIFENNRYFSNRITKRIKDGTFRFEDFHTFSNKLSKALREEASYSGTSGEMLSNYYVGTKEFNKILPHMFADKGMIKGLNEEFFDKLDIPVDVKAMARDRFNKVMERGDEIDNELDPAVRSMLGPYRINMIRELADYLDDDSEFKRLLSGLNVSTKDKSKLGKDVVIGANVRYLTGFTNPIDENSRPVIGGSGNVRYFLEENLDKAASSSQGLFFKGSLFESTDTLNMNRVVDDVAGNLYTGFTARTAYVGEIGLRAILETNKDKILKENKALFNQEKQAEKIYDFLSSYVNTFEQAKVFSAEFFDQITGGTMAADRKAFSLSKDIINAMDLTSSEKDDMYETLLGLRGSLVRGADGTITYVSATGKIVNHGDALIDYATYGGGNSTWVSKLNKGVFKHEIINSKGIVLTDEKINKLLSKYQDAFDGVDVDNIGLSNNIFETILAKEGLKSQYVVEDVNKTTLPKILVNEAEKSMNQLGYMRIGTVDDRVRDVLQMYGGDAADFIGTTVPTPDAIRAAMSDEGRARKALMSQGFNSIEDFLEAVKIESYAADRMLFGPNGLFKGAVAIGNDNLAGHKNKGSMMNGAILEAVAMLGKYELGQGIENEESLKLGFKKFVDIIQTGDGKDTDAFKFFKKASGEGVGIHLASNGLGLRLDGNRSLDLSFDNSDILDTERLENLFKHINSIIEGKGATIEDRLVHRFAKVDKDTGEFVRDNKGNIVLEDGITIGRAIFKTDADGTSYAYGSLGGGTLKLVIDSETQSGMSNEYVDIQQQMRDLRAKKQQIIENVQGRHLTKKEAQQLGAIESRLAGLENRGRELEDTGHLFRVGDRERNIFSQYLINDDLYEAMEGNLGEAAEKVVSRTNEVARSLDKVTYNNDYRVFGFLEDELMGQIYYNPYKEDLLTESLLKKNEYSHLKGVYEDITKIKGKNLGVDTAEKLHGVRMVELANRFNNNNGVTIDDLKNANFKVMTPEEYSKAFAAMGASIDDNVTMKNVILDLGEEFETMKEWGGKGRYIAVPGMGTALEDVDIKKDWHKMASLLSDTYQDEYLKLQGQDTDKRGEVIERMIGQVDLLNKSVTTFAAKNNLIDNLAKTEVYAVMDRTKILSLPDEKNPLLERAMVHGDSIANWQKQGLYYDAMFDSYEQFDKRGFFKKATLEQFGMKDESEMVEYLKTHGAVMIDDRYPNIRRTSLTTARHYLFDDNEMHATNASYMTKETLLKMLADSDGDSRSGFMLQQGRVSHALYEHKRIQAQDAANNMTFKDDNAREAWIKKQVMSDGTIDEDTYTAFRGIDTHQYIQAKTINRVYHDDVIDTNISDLLKTRKAQMITGNGERVIAEMPGGQSILGKEKLMSLNYDPSFSEVRTNLNKTNSMFQIINNHMADIETIDKDLATKLKDMIPSSGNILDYGGNEIDVLDKSLHALEVLNKNNVGIDNTALADIQDAVRQRVRINAYHAESLSKLGITAVGNVNHAFFGASQAAKNYYGVAGTSGYNKLKSEILSAMAYEIEQSSISSKKITLKAGDMKALTLSDILGNIRKDGIGGEIGNGVTNYDAAMDWMRQHVDAGKAVSQYKKITSERKAYDFVTGKPVNFNVRDKSQHADIAEYMYDYTIRTFGEVYSNEDMRKMAQGYSSIGTRKASARAVQTAQGMLDNSQLGMIMYGITGKDSGPIPSPEARGPQPIQEQLSTGYKKMQQLGMTSDDTAANMIKNSMQKMKHWSTHTPSAGGAGRALAMGVLGLAGGLIAAGYASGNPLNDANPEQVVQQQTKPSMSFGPDAPQMAPNNTGGYIINIKGDTKKGNRQLKKALKQAANSSVGGAVNINMSLKTSQEAGYSNKDIENILSDYF